MTVLLLSFAVGVGPLLVDAGAAQVPGFAGTPAPESTGADRYTVAFQPSAASLSTRQKARIAEIARYWKRQNATGLRVVGFGETGLDPQASLSLSKARAEAVRDELRKNGIRPEYISTFWRGGNGPSDHLGIHEDDAQNSRVDIQIVW
nr:OmpA family protein [Phaeovibrio sulfidiphilus]